MSPFFSLSISQTLAFASISIRASAGTRTVTLPILHLLRVFNLFYKIITLMFGLDVHMQLKDLHVYTLKDTDRHASIRMHTSTGGRGGGNRTYRISHNELLKNAFAFLGGSLLIEATGLNDLGVHVELALRHCRQEESH